MSSKRKLPKGRKGNVVWRQSSEEVTLAKKPRYNGFACGHGAHGDAKHNRAKAKRAWKQQLRREGASRGSFSLFAFAGLGHSLRRSICWGATSAERRPST